MTDPTYAALEARVKELEDIREINEVFNKWMNDCTGGFNGLQPGRMEALECLTDDATIEIHGLHQPGKGPKGREQFTKFWDFYYGDNGPLPYVFQTSVSEKVVVTGDSAVQRSNMLGILQARGGKPTIGLSARTNHFVRTPDGWRINKTTVDGGFSADLPELHGNLNDSSQSEVRTPWTYEG